MESLLTYSPQLWLKRVLRANGVFSLTTGAFLALLPGTVAELLGVTSGTLLPVIGLCLVLYGIGLYWLTGHTEEITRLGLVAMVLDFGWVLGSILLLLTDWIPTSTSGSWAIGIAAEIVLLFAVAQLLAWRRLRRAR